MWCFTLISVIVVVSAVRLSPTQFVCEKEGYDSYLGTDRYKSYKVDLYDTEKTLNSFVDYCETISSRVSYVKYQQEYSILADFPDDTIDQLMSQSSLAYSGLGSYYDGARREEPQHTVPWTTMDREFDIDESIPYSVPINKDNTTFAGKSTSWATVVVKAAEIALERRGYKTKLSWRYLYECMYSEDSEDNDKDEGVLPRDIMEFIRDKGLVTEEEVRENGIDCSAIYEETYHFVAEETEGPSKYSLMNAVLTDNPTVVLMAIDIHKAKFVVDMREDQYPIRCAYDNPTLYGIVTSYQDSKDEQEGYWLVESNIVPGENIALRLPCVENSTNANYAGIAAYAFSIVYTGPVPTTEPPVVIPTTEAPTTEAPTTEAPTTEPPTTEPPTTEPPTTEAPTTEPPTTEPPTTEPPTTEPPTTEPPTTEPPTTSAPDVWSSLGYVNSCDDLQHLIDYVENDSDGYINTINISGEELSCLEFDKLNFTRFFWLENFKFVGGSAEGANGFPNLKNLTIGNEKLQKITLNYIGNENAEVGKDTAYTDHFLEIKPSINLESITISGGSFVKWTRFILGENAANNDRDFPKLKKIAFGSIGGVVTSSSFFLSSSPLYIENLPALEELLMGKNAFYLAQEVRLTRLPALRSLVVDSQALFGATENSKVTLSDVGTDYFSPLTRGEQDVYLGNMTVYSGSFAGHVSLYLHGTVS